MVFRSLPNTHLEKVHFDLASKLFLQRNRCTSLVLLFSRPVNSLSYLPSSNSLSSLLASRLSFRSCRSISALIRFCSCCSSLRQHAMVDLCSPAPGPPHVGGNPGLVDHLARRQALLVILPQHHWSLTGSRIRSHTSQTVRGPQIDAFLGANRVE